ncbi:MAG: recombination protein RecR [Bacteroidia bacterium]|nr:MAG: recombination protein RecR [Bacteroidia bacterium]PIE86538.1 MAG: recombination protein RecR [Bacteroidia bacterium]
MQIQELPSKLLENAVNQFAKLPGVGKKTALRLVLHLLNQPENVAVEFGNALIKMRQEIMRCSSCNNISDTPVCEICSSKSRDPSLICVVESIRDVMAIENTAQFAGHYHVLGGIISPMDGVGPADLNISSLIDKLEKQSVKELIFALPTTMEGDTTNFYLFKKMNKYNIKITTLARGVSIGDELEYTDEITLGRSIVQRRAFEESLQV